MTMDAAKFAERELLVKEEMNKATAKGDYDAMAQLHADVESTGTRPAAQLADAIGLTGVTFGYTPDRVVLRGIDLKIPRNSTVAFVGESGSGKTTWVDLITGTLKPDGGVARGATARIGDQCARHHRGRPGGVRAAPQRAAAARAFGRLSASFSFAAPRRRR